MSHETIERQDASMAEKPSERQESAQGQLDSQSRDGVWHDTSRSPQWNVVEIRTGALLKLLGYSILAVITLHMMVMVVWFGFGHDQMKGVVAFFNVYDEQNLPTFFSSVQLVIASILLALCAFDCKQNQGKHFKHWVGLSLIFLFLSLDETAQLHEKTLVVTRNLFGTSGLFLYAWIIPFGLFAVGVLVAYSRFLLDLPTRTSLVFVLAGAIFVTGAIGMEMLEGRLYEIKGGFKNIEYMSLVTVEEILEMAGVFIFIGGLLSYLTADGRRLDVSLMK